MSARILVRHIPNPGVWKRAPLITPDGRKATADHDDVDYAWVKASGCSTLWRVGDDWYVCLDDFLGIGLAGLAATVAVRLGPTKPLRDSWWSDAVLPDVLLELLDYDPEGAYIQVTGLSVEQLVAVSTYLALTDRLCGAAGLEREGFEVASWGPIGDENWSLRVSNGMECEFKCTYGLRETPDEDFVHVPALASLGRGDWLPALEAALQGTS